PTAPTIHLSDGWTLNKNTRGQKGADEANDPVLCFFSAARVTTGCAGFRRSIEISQNAVSEEFPRCWQFAQNLILRCPQPCFLGACVWIKSGQAARSTHAISVWTSRRASCRSSSAGDHRATAWATLAPAPVLRRPGAELQLACRPVFSFRFSMFPGL